MNFREELSLLLRARIPVINIVGSEEARIIRVIEALAASRDWPAGEGLYSWDIADQFVCHREANPRFDSSASATPDTILTMIEGYKGGATFILKDFHHVWEVKKSTIRKLRNLSQKLPIASRRKNIIMITPEYKLPIELKDDVICLDCPKPDATEIDALIQRIFDDRMLHGVTVELRAKIVESALGLTSTEVETGLQDGRCERARREAGRVLHRPYLFGKMPDHPGKRRPGVSDYNRESGEHRRARCAQRMAWSTGRLVHGKGAGLRS